MLKQIILLFFIGMTCTSWGQDLYDPYSVKEIKITFEEPNWDVILDSLKYVGTKKRLLGKVQINGVAYDSVGVRYKGNSSYFNVRKTGSAKLPFNIKIDYVKKDQKLKNDYNSIKLSNVFRDPSFVREVLSYDIARKYMPAPKANFARVYVNDKLIGLYNSVESIDENFLQKHFGENEGLLFKCDPDNFAKTKEKPNSKCKSGEYASLMYLGQDSTCYKNMYELKSDYGWKQLIRLSKVLNETPEKIDEILNVDQTLWMHAYNNVLVNLDSYSGRLCHNYYMYLDTSGVFHPLLWDMNLSFGGFRYSGEGQALTNEEMQKMSLFLHYKEPKRPLVSKLLATPLYRKIYIAHLQTILKENFNNGDYLKQAKQIQSRIDFYVKNDGNKFYPYEAFKANLTSTSEAGKAKIIGITELMDQRVSHLRAHPLLQKAQPLISEARHSKATDMTKFSARVSGAQTVYLAYRIGGKGVFKRKKMNDLGIDGDNTSGDGVYGISLEQKKDIQYYFIAEAEKTAQLSPERASLEFYEVK